MSTIHLIKMTEFVLRNNYFVFNGKAKSQISKTPIGKNVPLPTLACTWMNLRMCFSVYRVTNLWYCLPLVLFRHIDDVFLYKHMKKKNFTNNRGLK